MATQDRIEFAVTVHEDESAPRTERFKVLRAVATRSDAAASWVTVEYFATAKAAQVFARGMALGFGYGSHAADYGYQVK
jgi:hypothetical protein